MKYRFWAVGCGLAWAVGKKVWADYDQLLNLNKNCLWQFLFKFRFFEETTKWIVV
jgi:hypothetical protein